MVRKLMVEIISKLSRFSESFLTISFVPTNHHDAQAIQYLPLFLFPKFFGLQNFVITVENQSECEKRAPK